ncbi:MAG TPA: OsmC family protein [Vicinamibacterales bacterium]|nr:OsmC family protein [Vicinamibacterales bacterium]
MADARPPLVAELVWSGELRFDASSGRSTTTVDGDGKQGASPMEHAAVALAGCMAADVVDIIRKGRHPLTALHVTFTGTRAEQPPRRFVEISLRFDIQGAVPPEAVDRAIALSREKYCSVLHSFRQDIAFSTDFHITP